MTPDRDYYDCVVECLLENPALSNQLIPILRVNADQSRYRLLCPDVTGSQSEKRKVCKLDQREVIWVVVGGGGQWTLCNGRTVR